MTQPLGVHLIADFWGVKQADQPEFLVQCLKQAVSAAKATLVDIICHPYPPSKGIAVFAVLKESHLALHSWPEKNFVALDIFVCGDCSAHAALDVLKAKLQPSRTHLIEHNRGSEDG